MQFIFHRLLLLINFLFNLDKGKGPMLLFSALHNSVLFVLTYNAEECQKSNKYCLKWYCYI